MIHSFVKAIQAGSASRETALKKLYQNQKVRKLIFQFVEKQKGNEADAWDLYHDALIVLDRKIRNTEMEEIESVTKYLYGISRLLWQNKMRRAAKIQWTSEEYLLDGVNEKTPELLYEKQDQQFQIQQFLSCLDEKGGQIMQLWQASYSMKEIAEKLNLSNEGLARKYKYRSHKKLLKKVAEQPQWEEWLA